MTEAAHKILARLLAEMAPAQKWTGAKFAGIKAIANTNVGQVGERFAVEALRASGYAADSNPRRGQWDVRAGGKTMEVKCASEDVGGAFQFNGIRYDARFDLLLVVGVAPNDIWFRFYDRRDLSDLPLAAMAKGVAGSYKLTRRPGQLFPVADFPAEARKFVGGPGTSPE